MYLLSSNKLSDTRARELIKKPCQKASALIVSGLVERLL